MLGEGSCSWLALKIFGTVLQAGLDAKGVTRLDDWAGVFSPFHVAFVVEVLAWTAGVSALRDTLAAQGLLEGAEVAYWDAEGQVWKTVHPSQAPPFGRLLDARCFAAARRELQRGTREGALHE